MSAADQDHDELPAVSPVEHALATLAAQSTLSIALAVWALRVIVLATLTDRILVEEVSPMVDVLVGLPRVRALEGLAIVARYVVKGWGLAVPSCEEPLSRLAAAIDRGALLAAMAARVEAASCVYCHGALPGNGQCDASGGPCHGPPTRPMSECDEPPSCLAGGVTTRADVAPTGGMDDRVLCPGMTAQGCGALRSGGTCGECGGQGWVRRRYLRAPESTPASGAVGHRPYAWAIAAETAPANGGAS